LMTEVCGWAPELLAMGRLSEGPPSWEDSTAKCGGKHGKTENNGDFYAVFDIGHRHAGGGVV
jgi:hypothetical protein